MKTITRIISSLALVALLFCSTSCLKDDPMINFKDLGVVIELPYNNHYLIAQKLKPGDDVSFKIMVNYTIDYASKVKSDIPVTLSVDESMVATYNATLSSTAKKYVLLPASTYTLPSSIVIKAGTQLAEATMAVNTSSLERGKYYILPVRITEVPSGYTISGNFGHLYLRVMMNN